MTAAWTLASLHAALDDSPARAAGELTTRLLDDHGDEHSPVLLVIMAGHGDLEIFVDVGPSQITASTLLWPCDEQPDRNGFNEFLLRTQKVMPLSNFGIVSVNGRDFYELAGELATTSQIDDVLTELRTLAENAISAATDLHGRHAA